MTRYVEFESTIKGGLPVLVKARIHPPEPDIGIFHWQPEPEIFWISGHDIKFDIHGDDWDRISRECLEEM